MKKPIFIIVSVILVFILLGVWIYILFFNNPDPEDTYANLPQDNALDSNTNPNKLTGEEINPTIAINNEQRLQQLTTTPVAGYQEVTLDASSTPQVFYIHAGTGHISAIDIVSGEETEISGTTVNLSRQGAITTNGLYTMIQSGFGASSKTVVGNIDHSSKTLETTTITEQVVSFRDTVNNTFIYAVRGSNELIAKEYNPTDHTSKTLFIIPFLEATIDWGDSAAATHYFYPKASSQLEGYLYKVANKQIERLPISGYGLTAIGNEETVIFSAQNNGDYTTQQYNIETKTLSLVGLTLLPEKCLNIKLGLNTFICGETLTSYDHRTPDPWYQGTISYADWLWELDATTGDSTALLDTKSVSGQELDIINPILSTNTEHLYFLNKNNHNLWLYRINSTTAN